MLSQSGLKGHFDFVMVWKKMLIAMHYSGPPGSTFSLLC